MAVEFVEEMNVETSTAGNYRRFIGRRRVQLGVRSSHNIPALAVQENPPTRFFELVLRTNSRSVRFRLRMDNLYLIGYQMENGRWLEFNNDDGNVHLIPEQGTAFLGFTGHYNDLERAADTSLTGTGVGHDNLVSGINELATSAVRRSRARYLIVVIMMFCEATRLRPVFEYIATEFQHGGQIQDWITTLVRSWGNFSGSLLRADAFPEEPFQIRSNQVTVPNVGNITDLFKIVEIIGILLGLRFRRPGVNCICETDRQQQCFLGVPLLQVFSVLIDSRGSPAGELYGTITVDDGLNTEYLYNRTSSSSSPQSIITPGGQNALLIIGPSQSSLAISNFTINCLLSTTLSEEQLVNTDISWYASEIGNLYDQPISRRLDGTNGSVTVNYAVLKNSVAAMITVTLEQGGGNTSNIYGTVSARYGNWRDDPNTTTSSLFNRSSDDYVVVRRGENIQLPRSVVAVPVDGSLIVTASLYSSSADGQIAIGTAELPAQMSGTSFSQIRTGGNSVRVTVDWSSRI